MESVNQFEKIRKWRSESTVRKKTNHYWSSHDHCVCCCLRRKSVKLHGIIEILLGWREQDYQLPLAKQPKLPQLKYLT